MHTLKMATFGRVPLFRQGPLLGQDDTFIDTAGEPPQAQVPEESGGDFWGSITDFAGKLFTTDNIKAAAAFIPKNTKKSPAPVAPPVPPPAPAVSTNTLLLVGGLTVAAVALTAFLTRR